MIGPAISGDAVMRSLARLAIDLERAPILWLGTVRPDGRPHIVPTWFDWDGERITIYARPEAQKVRNLRQNAHVMIALAPPGSGMDVELLEGIADIGAPSEPTRRFRRKYRSRFRTAGMTPERFASDYPIPLRIRPTRLLDWRIRAASRGGIASGERVSSGRRRSSRSS